MNNLGWISLYRKILENWIWDDTEKKDKFSAFIYLLLNTNHKKKKVYFRNEIIEVQRGQFITSIQKLSKKWLWSVKKVKNYLNILEQEGMIIHKRNNRYTKITICNYELYQDSGTTEGIAEANQRETKGKPKGNQRETKVPTNNNENNENNENNNIPPSPQGENPKDADKDKPEINLLLHLKTKIIENNFKQYEDKIIEFFHFRQNMPKRKQYQSPKGVNGLFRELNNCLNSGLKIKECLEIAMERNWLIPELSYFNKILKQQSKGIQSGQYLNRYDRSKIESQKFIEEMENE